MAKFLSGNRRNSDTKAEVIVAGGFRWLGKSLDGDRIVLERFHGNFQLDTSSASGELRRLIALDVETTGLDPSSAKVIEIGAREIFVDAERGTLKKVGQAFQSFADPGHPLSAETTRLTGITDADVAGQRIDREVLATFLANADFVVAHNAAFDRPFVEGLCGEAARVPWACSLEQVDWSAKGFPTRKLEFLAIYHGFFVDAHRALEDADALVHLLSFPPPGVGSAAYFSELLARAVEPMVWVYAMQSPFETKDMLRARGYQWHVAQRVWYRKIRDQDLGIETDWLTKNVYNGRFRGQVEKIDPLRNFAAR